MKCFAFLIALATLATMTMARISQMVLPGTVTAGRPFDAILEDSSYIQAVGQYGVMFGLVFPTTESYCPTCAGTALGYYDLSTIEKAKGSRNLTYSLTVPEGYSGQMQVVGAVTTLYGAAGIYEIMYFRQNITVF